MLILCGNFQPRFILLTCKRGNLEIPYPANFIIKIGVHWVLFTVTVFTLYFNAMGRLKGRKELYFTHKPLSTASMNPMATSLWLASGLPAWQTIFTKKVIFCYFLNSNVTYTINIEKKQQQNVSSSPPAKWVASPQTKTYYCEDWGELPLTPWVYVSLKAAKQKHTAKPSVRRFNTSFYLRPDLLFCWQHKWYLRPELYIVTKMTDLTKFRQTEWMSKVLTISANFSQ